jgi:hypothetical protein
MRHSTLIAALMLGIGCSCASGRLPNVPGLDVIVKSKPEALSADAAGARAVQATTRCETEFVRVLASGAFVLRLWPTHAAPDVRKCLAAIKTFPGVEYAEPDAPMKAS